jgi:hypothetical protein
VPPGSPAPDAEHVVRLADESVHGERPRVGEQDTDGVVDSPLGHAHDGDRLGRAQHLEVERAQGHPRQASRPDTDGGVTLDRAAGADHAVGGAAEHRRGVDAVGRREQCCLGLSGGPAGDPDEGEVGSRPRPELQARGIGGSARGLDEVAAHRQAVTGARGHGQGGHAHILAQCCLTVQHTSPVRAPPVPVTPL